MTINFYSFENGIRYEEAFFSFIDNLVQKHEVKITVIAESNQVPYYDGILWTARQLSFLAHATCKDKDLAYIKVYITDDVNDEKFASNLKLLTIAELDKVDSQRVIYVIPPGQTPGFRSLFAQYNAQGIECKWYTHINKKWVEARNNG